MSEVRFEYSLVPVIKGGIGNIIGALQEAIAICGSITSAAEAGYLGSAAGDINIFAIVMEQHLAALIGLYGSALGMAINVADEVGALEDWLTAEQSKYTNNIATKLEALAAETDGQQSQRTLQ